MRRSNTVSDTVEAEAIRARAHMTGWLWLGFLATMSNGILATDAHAQETAGWSPDTATLLYSSSVTGNSELYLKAGAALPVNLTSQPASDHWGRWSPDGTRILFQSKREGNWDIHVMAVDGTGVVNLTRHPAEDVLPEWSPDGQRILFFSSRGEEPGPRGELRGNLFVMRADGTAVTRLTRQPLSSSFGGDWAPDGRSIVFARATEQGVALAVMNADGSEERELSTGDGSSYGARYSPDGRRIAFHRERNGESRIMVMSVDGTNIRSLTTGGLHYDPMWSPDGAWIVFTGAAPGERQYDVLLVSADGGPVRPLVATTSDERNASWARSR